jgi:hypothetical protein
MLEMMPVLAGRRALRILCLGAHCDDIEIGCGGTLLALQEAGMVEVIDWVVLSGTTPSATISYWNMKCRNGMAAWGSPMSSCL